MLMMRIPAPFPYVRQPEFRPRACCRQISPEMYFRPPRPAPLETRRSTGKPYSMLQLMWRLKNRSRMIHVLDAGFNMNPGLPQQFSLTQKWRRVNVFAPVRPAVRRTGKGRQENTTTSMLTFIF